MKKMKSANEYHPRAIALLSGGLDSTLAAAVVKRVGIEVIGLYVIHLFAGGRRRAAQVAHAAAQLGIPLRTIDRSKQHLAVVRHPRHGYGAGVNPCIDCRIFMLRTAKQVMETERAQFVITGEVVGQRPMSQRRRALEIVTTESGLEDRLLRPLSANLLPDTLPVQEGWIKKDDLYAISGRSRAPQRALAREFGITDYPQPAGGCLLTDKSYAARVRDAFRQRGADAVTAADFVLLRYGRQFRIEDNVKVIIGRNEEENEALSRVAAGKIVIEPTVVMGPLTLVEGDPDPQQLRTAAALAGRYCDHADTTPITFTISRNGRTETMSVPPLARDDPRIAAWRI